MKIFKRTRCSFDMQENWATSLSFDQFTSGVSHSLPYFIKEYLWIKWYRLVLHTHIDKGMFETSCNICTRSKLKIWWSILGPYTTFPFPTQFVSGLLYSVLHLMVYNIKQAYEFICYIYKLLSQI